MKKRPDPTRHESQLPPDLSESLLQLERLRKARPELDAAASKLDRLLRAAFAAPPRFDTPYEFDVDSPIAKDIQQARLDGRPAFDVLPPAPALDDFDTRALAVTSIVTERQFSSRNAPKDLDASTIVQELAGLRESSSAIATWADSLGVTPETASASLRLALLPALAKYSAALSRLPDTAQAEGAGCPNCTMIATLAESRGLDNRWFARCGLCAAEWPISRLGCSACGESDPRRLISRFVEGDESRCRKILCESCGFALKVVSTLTPLSAPGLLVAELASIHLDLA